MAICTAALSTGTSTTTENYHWFSLEHKHGAKTIQNKSLLSSSLVPGCSLFIIYRSNAKQAPVSDLKTLMTKLTMSRHRSSHNFRIGLALLSMGRTSGLPGLHSNSFCFSRCHATGSFKRLVQKV